MNWQVNRSGCSGNHKCTRGLVKQSVAVRTFCRAVAAEMKFLLFAISFRQQTGLAESDDDTSMTATPNRARPGLMSKKDSQA